MGSSVLCVCICMFLCEFCSSFCMSGSILVTGHLLSPGISITRPHKPVPLSYALSCTFMLEPQGPITASLCEPIACCLPPCPPHRLPALTSVAYPACLHVSPTVSRLCCGHLPCLHAIPPTLAASSLYPEHTRLEVPGISPWRGHRAGPACCVGFVCATPRG